MWRYKFLAILLLVTFNEWLIYKIQRLAWTSIECSENCTKLLLIADPQILGNQHELLLARIDSDRHLSKNFREIFDFSRPDLVIFLGDLMDEGSIASDRQFLDYYRRFLRIFPIDRNATEVIFIPGDNDIGGEGFERVEARNVRRFHAVFGNETAWTFDHLEVLHVNRIENKIDENFAENDGNQVRVMVSHYAVLQYPDRTSLRAIEKLRPHLIFSAHDHKSRLLSSDPKHASRPRVEEISSKIEIKFDGGLKEVQVPSINYRMGTLTIGSGHAAVSDDGVVYAPLFVVSRFFQFAIYAVALKGFFLILCLVRCSRRCCRGGRRLGYRKLATEDKV